MVIKKYSTFPKLLDSNFMVKRIFESYPGYTKLEGVLDITEIEAKRVFFLNSYQELKYSTLVWSEVNRQESNFWKCLCCIAT